MLADILSERGVAMETIRIYAGDGVPGTVEGRGGLIVMGGPMGVYEQDRYPHLTDEIRLIQDAVARGVPVIGICLGSQLVAAALGAKVAPAHKEIGWHAVTLTEAALRDPLWTGIDRVIEVFHWHGDAFDLPPGAVSLAASRHTPCQAYAYGRKTYGFLFHMEMNESMVRAMVTAFGDELAAVDETAARILTRAPDGVRGMRSVAGIVFRRWADLLGSG